MLLLHTMDTCYFPKQLHDLQLILSKVFSAVAAFLIHQAQFGQNQSLIARPHPYDQSYCLLGSMPY